MKQPFFGYVSAASELNTPVTVRGRILASAIALAVACRLQVPSNELSDPAEYYTNHIEPTVLRVVCQFNEQTIVDLKYAGQLAKLFWQQRYDVLHECPRLDTNPSFFGSVFSVNTYFSDAEVEFFDQNQKQIAKIYNVACPLVEQLLSGAELG